MVIIQICPLIRSSRRCASTSGGRDFPCSTNPKDVEAQVGLIWRLTYYVAHLSRDLPSLTIARWCDMEDKIALIAPGGIFMAELLEPASHRQACRFFGMGVQFWIDLQSHYDVEDRDGRTARDAGQGTSLVIASGGLMGHYGQSYLSTMARRGRRQVGSCGRVTGSRSDVSLGKWCVEQLSLIHISEPTRPY